MKAATEEAKAAVENDINRVLNFRQTNNVKMTSHASVIENFNLAIKAITIDDQVEADPDRADHLASDEHK